MVEAASSESSDEVAGEGVVGASMVSTTVCSDWSGVGTSMVSKTVGGGWSGVEWELHPSKNQTTMLVIGFIF